MKTGRLEEMKEIYEEFGIDIHNIPKQLQSNVNNLVKEIIILREGYKQNNKGN